MAKTNISSITELKNYLTLEETNQIIDALQNATYDINAKSYLIDDVEIIDGSGKINASALPDDTVLSVNGETGTVTLDTDDIDEGTTNLYDKTVAFTGGTNVTVGGTYPNFTITDNSASSSALANKVDGTVAITVGTTAPSSPSTNDIWIDTN